MPIVVDVDDAVLSAMEDQGGLKADTLADRNRYYLHFEEYILGEMGMGVKEALETEDGRLQFEREFGR